MKVGIIGTGNVGTALATAFVEAGHDVTLTARDAQNTAAVAGVVGASTAATTRQLVRDADVVVLAVPWSSIEEIAREFGPISSGKIVIDVTNAAKPDWSGPLFAGSTSGAEELAGWLPDAHVVKAFNTITSAGISRPVIDGIVMDAFVAGDDAAAKGAVGELASSIGFNPIDAGPAPAARYLEALAWLNISLNMANGWTWHTGWKLLGVPVAVGAGAGR
jgi:predicted dinucleotide-binding enzyme